QLAVQDRVVFLGFRKDVAQLLREFDVLVHASLIPEPFGQVVLEGMQAGLPVIAADAGGPAELIEHGVNGLLYPAGDREALASALVTLAGNPELRARLGAAAKARAAVFRPDRIGPQLTELYQAVLGARAASRRRRDSEK